MIEHYSEQHAIDERSAFIIMQSEFEIIEVYDLHHHHHHYYDGDGDSNDDDNDDDDMAILTLICQR